MMVTVINRETGPQDQQSRCDDTAIVLFIQIK